MEKKSFFAFACMMVLLEDRQCQVPSLRASKWETNLVLLFSRILVLASARAGTKIDVLRFHLLQVQGNAMVATIRFPIWWSGIGTERKIWFVFTSMVVSLKETMSSPFTKVKYRKKKVLLLHQKDVLLDGRYVEFFHQGQVNENLFSLLHPWWSDLRIGQVKRK